MMTAFILQGFSTDRTFSDPSLDLLRGTMAEHDIQLHGVTNGWQNHGIQSFGRCAIEQLRKNKYDGILIGHSLGALAALSVVDAMPMRHLILCSPSALFSEDINSNLDPAVCSRIGEKRLKELSNFSAADAVSSVNRLRIPTTILFGERERELHPRLVARSGELAAQIEGATLLEVIGAEHSVGENPYALELARIVSNVSK